MLLVIWQGLHWICKLPLVSSVTQSCLTLCNPMDGSTPGFPVYHHLQSLLKLKSIRSVMPSNHLILCFPLLLLPWIFPNITSFPISQLFESGGQGIGASAEAFQWIFKVDFLYDWLIGSPCCPRDSEESSLAPQFESIDFLALSLLYGYMTTGKTIVLTIWTFVRKVMSLLFNTLSRNFPVAHMVKNLFAM